MDIAYIYFFYIFRTNCKRFTIKTGKKDTQKLRCHHEAIVSLLRTNTQASSAVSKCNYCDKTLSQSSMVSCQACPTIQYCSRTCQDQDWPTHKSDCCLTLQYMTNTGTMLPEQYCRPNRKEISGTHILSFYHSILNENYYRINKEAVCK